MATRKQKISPEAAASDRLGPFVDTLVALRVETDDRGMLTDAGTAAVIGLVKRHKVTSEDFYWLDEKPGLWGYRSNEGGWHWKLRQLRNDPDSNLFATLRGEE